MEEEHIKVLSNENIGESKLVSSIHFYKLSGQQVFFSGPQWTPSREEHKTSTRGLNVSKHYSVSLPNSVIVSAC
jgi:hypothetical protein